MATPPRPRENLMITELILLKLAETLAQKHGWIRSAPTLGKLLAESSYARLPIGSPEYTQGSLDAPDIAAVSSSLPLQSAPPKTG